MSYPPQPPHTYGQGGYGGQPIEHPQGTTILVLGILSVVLCGILGPFAWVMGNKAIREIDASGMFFSNRSSINAGRICGIITTCLMIASAALLAVAIVLAVVVGSV